jgi:hypothetical protein
MREGAGAGVERAIPRDRAIDAAIAGADSNGGDERRQLFRSREPKGGREGDRGVKPGG